MRILILGGGAVGELVARRLIREKNEVTLVESNEDRRDYLEEVLDAKIVHGNAARIKTLEQAGLITADMLIAVTNSDEVNVLSCLIAQAYSNVGIKVARLRTHEVDRWRSICQSKLLGVDLVIHPDSETTERILNVIPLPGISDVISFADGRVNLFGMMIDDQNPLVGKTLRELDQIRGSQNALIVMIFRGRRVVVPRGDDRLLSGDFVHVVVPKEDLEASTQFMGVPAVDRVERIFVLGGKQLGIEVALRLENENIQVKLFEKDLDRCEKIASLVKSTVVVHGDGTDQRLLSDENVEGIDAYLALTSDDEVNLIACLLAKRLGAKKAVALINRIEFQPMAQLLGVNASFSTRLVVVDRILQFIRKGQVLSVTTLREDAAEAIELVATPGSKYIGKALKDVHLPKGAVVGAIVRPNGEVIVPRGDAVIKVDDRVIFFCLEHLVPKLERAFIY